MAEGALIRAEDAARLRWDAIVIGAGPAGSLAACLLARERLKVLLAERQALPRSKVCGGCLNARALASLERAGLAARVRALGAREVHRLSLHHRGRTAAIDLPPGLAVSRRALDEALALAAAESGATLMTGTLAVVVPEDRGTAHDGLRYVALHQRDGLEERISARVVVSADGLAHTSLRECAQLTSPSSPASRVGIGGETAPGAVAVEPGTITMAIGSHGYVGAVEVEGGRINIAAALDPESLRSGFAASGAVKAVLSEAGVGASPALDAVEWKGTIPLTRRLARPAARGLFVIGDAAGYVEPFTGEGMAWALAGAEAAVPFVRRALGPHDPVLEDEWVREYDRVVGRGQRRCRAIARLLRRPALVTLLVALLGRHPGLARPVLAGFASPSAPGSERIG
jgi:flavin-dependent dehydrogenase